MLHLPHAGAGTLWLFACTVLGGALAARGRREQAEQQRPGPSLVPDKRPERRGSHRSRKSLETIPAHHETTRAYADGFCRRTFDVVLGAVLLLAIAPLLAVIAVGIALTLGRPIFFSQQRVGRGGRLFRLHKFRTLAPRPLARSEVEWSAPAAHPFAALLRHTGLDELPQLINVLRGEMSLVGPRPERPHFVRQFRKELPGYAARHIVQPGITGWAQVHGFRGDTSIGRRLEYDIYYLNHRSLELDLWILLRTMCGVASNLWTFFRGNRPVERTDFV